MTCETPLFQQRFPAGQIVFTSRLSPITLDSPLTGRSFTDRLIFSFSFLVFLVELQIVFISLVQIIFVFRISQILFSFLVCGSVAVI